MRRMYAYCGALGGAAVVAASLAVGSGLTLARTPAPAHMGTMGAMGTMPMGQAASRGGKGATIRLHQRVVRVTIHNFAFHPARLVVSPGTRIIWTNTDSDPHTVDSAKNIWTSEALDTDGHFARVFKKTGTFAYYCSIHPFMHGTIVVKK